MATRRSCRVSTWTPGPSLGQTHTMARTLCLLALVLVVANAQNTPWINVAYDMVETLAPLTYIGNVGRDAGLDEMYGIELEGVTFNFLPNQDSDVDLFMIDEHAGIFRTAQEIDRDTLCPGAALCQREVKIGVVGPNRDYHLVKVIVTIVDLNDNAPTFNPSSYELTVNENSPPNVDYPLPTARDRDSGIYGIQTYELVSYTDIFSLSVANTSDNGFEVKLYVNDVLDREITDTYSVELIARDGANPPLEGTLHITVHVGDANDNRPEFNNSSYSILVSESFPLNQTIITVHAVDHDAGLNGQVVYGFSYDTQEEHGALFGINPNTGGIYLKAPLDYEEASQYRLTVTAQDLGTASVPTTARVTILLEDVNDYPPQITVNGLSATGQVSIPENSNPHDLVADIQVSDSDSGPGGKVDCTLTDPYFSMEQYFEGMYRLLALQSFDREQQATYTVTVRCQDHGSPTLTSSLTIPVDILDINDHSPQFSRTVYTTSVTENNPPGMTIITVNATDFDFGPNSDVTYTLMGSNIDNILTIDPSSGRISATEQLDYETTRRMEMTVVATDGGDPPQSSTALVDINILDVDDEPPVFTDTNYSYATFENQVVGTEIATVRAVDIDSPYVTYSLDPRNSPTETFQIDPNTGRITIRQVLDREATSLQSMVVVAQGGNGPSSSVIVTVHVADVNDNAPLITFPNEANNTVHVPYNAPAGYVFTTVLATDADFKANNDLVYSIDKGDDDHLFNIDAITGVISTNALLRDLEWDHFQLLIAVSDKGNPPKSAVEELNIVVNHTLAVAYVDELPPLAHRNTILNQNQTILISMSVITAFLVLILIIAIIYVKRKHPKREESQYKCKVDYTDPNTATGPPPRCMSRGVTVAGSGDSLDMGSSSESSLPQHHPRLRGDLDSSRDTGEGESETLCTRAPSLDSNHQLQLQGTPVSVHPYPGQGSPRYGPSPVPHSNHGAPAHKASNLPRHRLVEDPRNGPRSWNPHVNEKDLEVHRLLHMVMQEPNKPQDSDNASGCSAEVSNTDSGRGASEDGDGHHVVQNRTGSPGPHHGQNPHPHEGMMNPRGRSPMSRDGPPPARAHIAYVTPNRHGVRKPPNNMSSFKHPGASIPSQPPNPPLQGQQNPYNYPTKRAIQFTPVKGQPPPPPYNSNSLKRDNIARTLSRDCGCQGPCNHRRTNVPEMRSQSPRDRTVANPKDPRGCEMKPVNSNGWPANSVKLDRVSYLDSVV